jgi:hypothetical protein
MSEESVMKQALSPEVPARVRRGQFRAITLGVGASALAMACSFGEIEGNSDITPIDPVTDQGNEPQPDVDVDTANPTTNNPTNPSQTPSAVAPDAEPRPFDPNDPFSTEIGTQVYDILRVNCSQCHVGAVRRVTSVTSSTWSS